MIPTIGGFTTATSKPHVSPHETRNIKHETRSQHPGHGSITVA
jgi:hypothetical protein